LRVAAPGSRALLHRLRDGAMPARVVRRRRGPVACTRARDRGRHGEQRCITVVGDVGPVRSHLALAGSRA